MALYRNSRFPKGSFLMVLAIVAIFIVVFQLMTNESTLLSGGSKSAPNDPRIAIVTFTTQEESYTHLSLKNKNLYARRHGYDLFVDWETIEPRGPYWYKFVMLEQVIAKEKYDWIWWIDFDTLITNTTVKLEDIIQESLENSTRPNDIDFLLNVDCHSFNAGSMLVRSRPSALVFLNLARALHDADGCMEEQDCITKVVKKNAHGEADQTLWIPQWKINAYPEEITCLDKAGRSWERGLFVVHFPGAAAHIKVEDAKGFLMRKYEGEII